MKSQKGLEWRRFCFSLMNLLECTIQQLISMGPAVSAKAQPLPSNVLVLSVRGLRKGQSSQRGTFYTHWNPSLQTSFLAPASLIHLRPSTGQVAPPGNPCLLQSSWEFGFHQPRCSLVLMTHSESPFHLGLIILRVFSGFSSQRT